ncbi:MAG: FtsQ-type POTRA domain-containing protein [Oscillospiraceae bacterium]|nr:FtsQ-type POTRA domain-containing protein [Oscillospiraceae bacterium]
MAQHQRKHYRRRGHLRFGRLYGLLSALVILAAIIVGCIVFFRVNTVEVVGNTRYTQEEIVETAGIEYGSNMFLFNKFQSIDALLQNLTYVESVSIRRSMPSTIRITVEECSVAAALEDPNGNGWWLVNTNGKLLELVDSSDGYMTVTGLALLTPTAGQNITVEETQRLQRDALLALLPALESRALIANTQNIDLSSPSQVLLLHDGRLTVKIDLNADFDYEIRVLATVMEEYVDTKWSATDSGTLDLTNEDGRPHLIRNAQ